MISKQYWIELPKENHLILHTHTQTHAQLLTLLTSDTWNYQPVQDLGTKLCKKSMRLATSCSLAGFAGS